MRLYLILCLFILSNLTLSAQCPDYQSELQNMESCISNVIRYLKKAEKATTLEEAQQFVDKAVSQAEITSTSANLAKEYAAACNCDEGINSTANIYNTAFDCRTQAQKAANCGLLEELKELVKKSLIIAGSVKDETTEGTSYCLE
jgi:esterase/lipase